MKVGVTGWQGRLGSELIKLYGYDPIKIDISDADAVFDLTGLYDVIVNCAAFTPVDACEDRKNQSIAITANYNGPVYLAKLLPETRIIHISSDYVFGGKRGPYKETDELADDDMPVNYYGLTKLSAELALCEYDNAYIVRTTGLYGRSTVTEHHDFVRLIRHSLEHELAITISKNLYGNQTYIPHLADGIDALLGISKTYDLPKIVHIASSDVVSRYEFALMIASVFDLDKNLIIPTDSKNVPGWIAKRPVKGGLRTAYATRLDIPICSILDGLQELKDETCCYHSVLQ